MHAYRDQYASLFHGGRDIVLIGISTDSPEALQSWAQDDEFPFLFASDPGSGVGQHYGAFREGRERSPSGPSLSGRWTPKPTSSWVRRWTKSPP